MSEPQTPLDRFRAAVMADPAIQQQLAEPFDPAEFNRIALPWANERGIALAAGDLAAATHHDPLGISAFDAPPQTGADWPPAAWLPRRFALDGQAGVDWIHFAGEPLTGSFYSDTIARVGSRPFNKLFRYRTPFAPFMQDPREDSLKPSGFIFHMSRCGSTLVSQMLAAVPDHIVPSEPEPLDTVVQLPLIDPSLPQDVHIEAFRAMVAALGRDRTGTAKHFVIKTDSWHSLALPLFRAAFPDVPWVFLYRDPVEVLVSQMRMRGAQAAQGVLPPQIFGIDPNEQLSDIDYTARILAQTCEAVLNCWGMGGGMLVEYRELPEAVFTRILPHFGIAPSDPEAALMRAASQRDAKSDKAFRADSEEKRAEADDAVRAAAETYLSGVYDKLKALRTSEPR